MTKYQDLKNEVKISLKLKNAEIVPTLIEATSSFLAWGSLAAGVAIISWKRDSVADAVPLYQYTLVLILPISEG